MRDSWLPSEEQQRAAKLLYLIMNEQIRAQPVIAYVNRHKYFGLGWGGTRG